MSQANPVEQESYSAGFHVAENYAFKSGRGLNREIVEKISEMKGEPSWMRNFRIKSLEHFVKRPMPTGVLTCRVLTSIISITISSQYRNRAKPGKKSHPRLRIHLIGSAFQRLSASFSPA